MAPTVFDRVLGSGIPYITYAIPFFFALIGVEAAVSLAQGRPYYRLHDSISDLACGITDQVVGLFLKTALFGGYLACYGFVTSRGLNLVDVGAYGPAGQWAAAIALFLGVDLAYYWFHRIAHEWNAPWAGHVVHHSSERYNLSTALRQPWTPFTSLQFWLPLAFLGFAPWMILMQQSISLIYQFFIHTERVGKLSRPIEFVMNTPSHHRVHHGSNQQYLDKNYGGTLIVWDRLFGTFEPEREKVVYGLTHNIKTFNPLKVAFGEFAGIWRDVVSAPSARDALGYVFRGPGWQPRST